MVGIVRRFNQKHCTGFIIVNDAREGIFVRRVAIAYNEPRKGVCSLREGDVVECDMVHGKKGPITANGTRKSADQFREALMGLQMFVFLSIICPESWPVRTRR